MQNEPIHKDEPIRKDGPKESAAGELKAMLPWFLIPVAIILVLLGLILFLPGDQAEAGQAIGQHAASEAAAMHSL